MSKSIDESDGDYLPLTGGAISGALTVSGAVTTVGILFPSPTLLNYYEEYNYSSTFTGCGTTTPSVTIKFTRVGRVVTVSVENVVFTAASAGLMTLSSTFPARFNSSSFTGNQHFATIVSNNGTQQVADAFINNSNQIILTGTAAGGNFVIGSAVIYKFAATWTY